MSVGEGTKTRSPRAVGCLVIAIVATWHGVVGSLLGLGDAEALYFNYALHLSGGYVDHPPLIGWLIAASTAVLGDAPAAVRLVPSALHALTMVGVYVLARDCLSSDRAGLRAIVAMALVPMMTVGGTSTPVR